MSDAITTEVTTGVDAATSNSTDGESFEWTVASIAQSIVLFFLAGVAEILGGWMVWMAIRGNGKDEKRPWWFAVLGSLTLVLYGFIPCFQPTSNFGRIYAVYGGVFIVMSYFFGWLLDGVRPDVGDVTGGCVAIIGVCLAYFWPRS
mmetsp:Transcript_23634/g.49724  ORF Transcript_23634/g.49724 Transcript_23634/m.49724 type:complete len:146 (-) Transcript_23634:1591-2028(-)